MGLMELGEVLLTLGATGLDGGGGEVGGGGRGRGGAGGGLDVVAEEFHLFVFGETTECGCVGYLGEVGLDVLGGVPWVGHGLRGGRGRGGSGVGVVVVVGVGVLFAFDGLLGFVALL